MIGVERSIAGLKAAYAVDQLDIEYLQGAATKSVLLHGFGADKDNWTRIARHLVDEFNVIAIDLPGFGNTPVYRTRLRYSIPSHQT